MPSEEDANNADGIVKEGKSYTGVEDGQGKCLHYLCCRCSKRYYTAWLCCFGFMITFGIRCNIGWVMLAMQSDDEGNSTSLQNATRALNQTLVNGSHPFSAGHLIRLGPLMNTTSKPDFYWPLKARGFVDTSFFYGYLVTQIPAGVIAAKFPANRLFGLAVGGSALINLILPMVCRVHYGLVIFFRILQGLIEGTSYPACHGIWRYWAPPLERSRLATIAFCGSYAGVVIGLSLSGFLAQYLGWQAPFYFYGVIGLSWFVWWWRISAERPSIHKTITSQEKSFIEAAIGESPAASTKKIPIPWRKFFTSMPVYAIIVANFARSWSFYLLITKSPKYFRQTFNYSFTETGFLSALPHLLMAIIVPIGGQFADRLRKRRMTTTNVRKLFNCGGFGMEAVFLLGVGYSKNVTSAIVCLCLAVWFSGFAISGYNVNHLDIAPRYASILMGLSNGVGTISGLICPLTAELLTEKKENGGWPVVFLMASLVHFAGVLFYAVFASGEQQQWAIVEDEDGQPDWKPPTDIPPEMTLNEYKFDESHFKDQGYLASHELTPTTNRPDPWQEANDEQNSYGQQDFRLRSNGVNETGQDGYQQQYY